VSLRTRLVHRDRDDRGAALIYTVVILVGLMATATFVVDFGMLVLARRQAQNAADAGAYAAAVALAQDMTGDRSDTGPTVQSAMHLAAQHLVWGEAPALSAADVTFPPCPDGTDTCVRVEVHRTQARGNPLPTVFGRLAGLTSQDMRAIATAEVRPANVSKCIKPWAVPDRWSEHAGSATTFDKYTTPPGPPAGPVLPNPDQYVAPTATSTGTGYRLNRDLGSALLLRQGCSLAASCGQAQLGGFLAVNFVPGCPSASFGNAIAGCAMTCDAQPAPVTVGIDQPLKMLQGVVSSAAGVGALVALDPSATYNPVTKRVENSCVGGGGVPYTCSQPGFVESPRIVAIPAFDVNWFEDHRRPGGVDNLIRVTNILSVFVNGMIGADVSTHIVAKSGPWDPTRPVVTGGAAFTRTILLVR
jgi:hypothetical protein